MANSKKAQLDLAEVFQAVSGILAKNQASLNQADDYNHNHGDNMVEIFGVVSEAVEAKRGKRPSTQLAYASKLLEERSQSGSAQLYASGLAQAARQFRGKSVTNDNITTLLGSLFGGQATGQASSGAAGDLLGSLLSGMVGGQETGQASSGAPGDLLSSLLGGSSTESQASSQPGIDLGDILAGGMAFMQSQQQGEGTVQSMIKAFVAATQVGQKSHRAQSGELVANTVLQLFGKRSSR